MQTALALKALADETRMKIVLLLLRHDLCVRALARQLALSEAAVSQQLKRLRKAGLVAGEKRGYFMHYHVDRPTLHALARELDALAELAPAGCPSAGHTACPGHCHLGHAPSGQDEEKAL